MTTPFSAQDEAQRILSTLVYYTLHSAGTITTRDINVVAEALFEAFQRGREVEREECAKVAESWDAKGCASEIRNRTRIVEEK